MKRSKSRRRPARRRPGRSRAVSTLACSGVANDGVRLRDDRRERLLRHIIFETAKIRWSPALLKLLVEELYVDEELATFLGDVDRLPVDRFPQAVAVALALRHSWREDDFSRFAKRLHSIAGGRLAAGKKRITAGTLRKRMLA